MSLFLHLTTYTEDLEWFDRSYLIDWTVATALWLVSGLITISPVFRRDFSLDDPLIAHPRAVEQVSRYMNTFISIVIPFVVAFAIGTYRRSAQEVHHGLIAVWSGRGLTRLITELLKNRVGRLRPDFLACCQWDSALQACTGNAAVILDGRRSFPSGHSSAAFAAMTFISLLIAGKTAAWCFARPSPTSSFLSSKLANFSLTILPFFCATWIAVTRVEDYRHHKEDVIVGSIIGIVSSSICYLMFWPNPFDAKSFTYSRLGRPKTLYTYNDDDMSRDELNRLEVELGSV